MFSIQNNPFDDDYAERWEGAGKRADEAVAEATKAAHEVLQEQIIESGTRSGLPGEILDAVEYMNTPLGPQVGIPGSSPLADKAREEEYGKLFERPKGVMRTAQRRARQEAEEVFSEVLHEELFG